MYLPNELGEINSVAVQPYNQLSIDHNHVPGVEEVTSAWSWNKALRTGGGL